MVQRCSLPAESKDEPHAGRRSHSSALVRTHPHALRSLRLTRDYVLTPQRRLEYPVYLPAGFPLHTIPSVSHSLLGAFQLPFSPRHLLDPPGPTTLKSQQPSYTHSTTPPPLTGDQSHYHNNPLARPHRVLGNYTTTTYSSTPPHVRTSPHDQTRPVYLCA